MYSKTIVKNIICRSSNDQCNQNKPGNQHPNRMAPFNIVIFKAEVRNIAHHQDRQAVNNQQQASNAGSGDPSPPK